MHDKIKRFVIISPFYNEEKVILRFLGELEEIFLRTDFLFTVILVNDCSTDLTQRKVEDYKFQSDNHQLKSICLRYNVGHQEAIKQGLKFASQFDADGYIIMDSDGEDDPSAILQLVEITDFEIIFISRGKRKEALTFKIGYFFYKVLFKIISGNRINFGNYTMINQLVLKSASQQNFVHYSAFLSKLKYQKKFIRFDRRARIDGKSKMKSSNLVMHGLKSLIEYSEEVLFFFFKLLAFIFLTMLLYGSYVIYTKFISKDAISGWASIIIINLINSVLIISAIIVLGLLILSKKDKNESKDDIFY
jgi:glycosyltransferase involved in cell wall biosynthesis